MTTISRLATLVAASASFLAAPLVAYADPAPAHVRGTIASFSPTSVTIATATGNVVAALAPKTGFVTVTPGTANDIKAGSFIGSANVPAGGAARALEVVVFAPALRGVGEGNYPWDLAPTGSHSSMTNGTVGAPKQSSMTNATVSHVMGGSVKTIDVAYKGGTKRIAIPDGTPIVDAAPGSAKILARGAHVFAVVGMPGGKSTALFVVVGRGDTVPPM